MGTSAELAGMSTSSNTLSELGATMSATLGQLRGDVEMTRGAWAGAAQVAFQKVMTDWDTNSAKLNDALKEIGEMLGGNTTAYRTSEQNGEQALLGLGGTVNI